MKRLLLMPLLVAAGANLLASCANPVPPTGGPADQTPPVIESTVPENRAVNVSADALQITFSEHVNQATFARALTITPSVGRAPEIRWRGRTATVRFSEPLRENTTYVVQLDNTLQDARGVPLRAPITFAFATGAEIDTGEIQGRVLDAADGRPVQGVDVYAYQLADPSATDTLPGRPDYRTQTGSDGGFRFEYLPEGARYYVVALVDENQNRSPEPREAFAAPPDPAIAADTVAAAGATALPWILTQTDTVAPEAQRARALSSRRIAIQFSERIRLDSLDPSLWSLRGPEAAAREPNMVYQPPENAREVVVLTDSLPPGSYELVPGGIVDSAGNPVRREPVRFEVGAVADTFALRFVDFRPDTTEAELADLLPEGAASVAFSIGTTREQIAPLIQVTDTAGTSVDFDLQPTSGAEWRVLPSDVQPGEPFIVTIADPQPDVDTTYTRRFAYITSAELGEISGVVVFAGDAPIVVELKGGRREAPYVVPADDRGHFLAEGLPAGRYFVRAYADLNSSMSWSGGSILPYRRPEPLTWHPDSVRVRARWETAMEDTLWLLPRPENIPEEEVRP